MEAELIAVAPPRYKIIEHYSREDVLEEMMKFAKNREFVGVKKDKYLSRPSLVQFKSDIVQLAKLGATSFHCSVERWENVAALSTETNYDNLRIGWDLLIDIDSRIGLEGAKIAASLVVKLLKSYGISCYGLKFSGSRGFHLLVPWEAFPKEVNYQSSAKLYPYIPNALASFICNEISDELLSKLVKTYTAKQLSSLIGFDNLDPFMLVEIERNWGSRHLFRVPFSLNEKTWLVSIPLESVDSFTISDARIEKVKVRTTFLKEASEEEAKELLRDALNWWELRKREVKEKKKLAKKSIRLGVKVDKEFFPPCIKNILRGLSDGRKRSCFTLINFLRVMGYDWEEIEHELNEWNKRNARPLSQSFLNSQLNWNKNRDFMLPANCDNDLFYKSIGICEPDETCKLIRNPVAYPFKKYGIRRFKRKEKRAKYVCRLCNRAFKTLRGLKMHQIRYHGDRVI